MANYTVAAGDTASGIAQKLGLSSYNQLGGLGSNPSLIHPGQVLTYGSSSPAAPSAPSPAKAPSSGGFAASTPDATLNGDISSLNQAQSDYQAQSKALSDALNAFTGQQQQKVENAWQTAAGQTGLEGDQAAVNKIQSALTGSENASAAVVPQTIAASRGSMANQGQVDTQSSTSNIPYAEQVAQLSANLVPAENLANTAMQNTQQIAGNIVTGAQLAEQGFTAGMQSQLQALQSKIDTGTALTNDEYNSYTQLKAAQTQAAASVQSAQIGAGAQIQAANIGAANALKIAALQNPGISIKTDANGNYQGQSFLNSPSTPAGVTTPNGSDLASIKSQLASQIASNPSFAMSGNDTTLINNLAAQTGLSQSAAATLFYTVRKPYESSSPSPSTASSSQNPFQVVYGGSPFPNPAIFGK